MPSYLTEEAYFSGKVSKQFDMVHGRMRDWAKFLDGWPKRRPLFLPAAFHDANRPSDKNAVS